jgi:hypothetical protein
MTRPVVTAADRATAESCIRRTPTGIQGDEWTREINVLETVHAIATALATARAEGLAANDAKVRDQSEARGEAIRFQRMYSQQVMAVETRVQTLETALHMLINATEALAHSANLSLADDALDAARRALTPDTMDPTVTRLRIRGRLINRARP